MKNNNYAIIIIIIFFSIAFSIFIPPILFKNPTLNTVETVPVISNSFVYPSTQFFNTNSIDLTPYTQIGNGTNLTPFGTPKP